MISLCGIVASIFFNFFNILYLLCDRDFLILILPFSVYVVMHMRLYIQFSPPLPHPAASGRKKSYVILMKDMRLFAVEAVMDHL